MQPVAQFDRHQRVRPEVEEPTGRGRRLSQPQEVLDLALQELGDEPGPLGHRDLLQLTQQLAVPGRLPGGARQHEVQDRRTRTAQHLGGALPVGLEHRGLSGAVRDHLGHRAQRGGRLQRDQTLGTDVGHRGLGGGHAALRPRPEVDAGGRQPLRASLRHQAVEQRVGRRVVGLAGRAEQARHRRRDEEEVEVVLARQAVQMAGAECLGCQRGPEPLQALLGQQCVVEDTGQVCHPRQRRQLRADPLQQRGHLGVVADVGGKGVHAAPVPLGDLVDHPLGVGIGGASAGQHDVPGAELGQIRRGVQADRTESTGDQVAAVGARLQRIRDLDHDLADVARLLHPPERGPGLRDRVDLGR